MNLLAWHARQNGPRFVAPAPVELVEITALADRRPESDGRITLGFRLASRRPEQLEALRDARRAIIREETTRGLDEGESSMAEAVFSATGIFWEVPFSEQFRCREKLASLVRRANRLIELSAEQRQVSAAN